jgi:cyclopropane fatty-acyl-phospholipid synthase-like methyltransferase
MELLDYHKRIVEYYNATEHAYRDSWDLDNSLAIHYGYWDEKVHSFPASLVRMNEVMAEQANMLPGEKVLDAGCGVGGSSIFLASIRGAAVTGITLSAKQVQKATDNAKEKGVGANVNFQVMDYCNTSFPDGSFDIVWGCESICYAGNKEEFIKEAWRLLKPGGRLIVADGFVTQFQNNEHPVIRKWLDGWQVNYLETPHRFADFMKQAGFKNISYRDISKFTANSCRRLYRFFFLASLYLIWKKLTFSYKTTPVQKGNIHACKNQYIGMKRKLWEYGMIGGIK